MKEVKRFQECNKVVKLWRYRWYLALPFLFIWRMMKVKQIPGHEWDEEKQEIIETKPMRPTGKLIWRLTIGEVQCRMHWYYTSEEVFDRIDTKLKD
jgi:hypothetical protein